MMQRNLTSILLTLVIGMMWIASALVVSTPILYAQTDECPEGYEREGDGPCLDDDGNPPPINRDGIFTCEVGDIPTGVAQFAANNIHVPVSDAAVTKNTAYLVYKECVLDGLIAAYREAATASLVGDMMRYFLEGDDGEPLFVQNLDTHDAQVAVDAFTAITREGNWSNAAPAFVNDVRTAVMTNFFATTQQNDVAGTCNFPGSQQDHEAFLNGDFKRGGIKALMEVGLNPACNPIGAYSIAQRNVKGAVARAVENERTQLDWGQGIKSATQVEVIPTSNGEINVRNVVTPGSLLQGIMQQYTGSGFRQLESATEIDQLIGALFAGFSNRVVTNTGGLAGINDSIGGVLSFLEQLIEESTERARQATSNTALQILTSSLAIETQYLALRTESNEFLDEGIEDLRGAEAQCWVDMEAAVRASGSSSLRVATSTAYSTEAMQDKINPLQKVIVTQIEAAEAAVAKLRQLIASVTGGSRTAQQLAITELDTMLSQGKIHRPEDVEKARNQRDDIENTIESDVDEAVQEWKNGDGWCNIGNPAVVQRWKNQWQR